MNKKTEKVRKERGTLTKRGRREKKQEEEAARKKQEQEQKQKQEAARKAQMSSQAIPAQPAAPRPEPTPEPPSAPTTEPVQDEPAVIQNKGDVVDEVKRVPDEHLPSHQERQRSNLEKRFTALMDELLPKIAVVTHKVNTYTGTDYSGLEALSREIKDQGTYP